MRRFNAEFSAEFRQTLSHSSEPHARGHARIEILHYACLKASAVILNRKHYLVIPASQPHIDRSRLGVAVNVREALLQNTEEHQFRLLGRQLQIVRKI